MLTVSVLTSRTGHRDRLGQGFGRPGDRGLGPVTSTVCGSVVICRDKSGAGSPSIAATTGSSRVTDVPVPSRRCLASPARLRHRNGVRTLFGPTYNRRPGRVRRSSTASTSLSRRLSVFEPRTWTSTTVGVAGQLEARRKLLQLEALKAALDDLFAGHGHPQRHGQRSRRALAASLSGPQRRFTAPRRHHVTYPRVNARPAPGSDTSVRGGAASRRGRARSARRRRETPVSSRNYNRHGIVLREADGGRWRDPELASFD